MISCGFKLSESQLEIRAWKTCLTVMVDNRIQRIRVSYTPAPPEFGFTDYVVSLNNVNTLKKNHEIITNKTSVMFSSIEEGTYVIHVYPLDYNEMCGCVCSRRRTERITIDRKGADQLFNMTICKNETETEILIGQMIETTTQKNWNLFFLILPFLFLIAIFGIIYQCRRRRLIPNNRLSFTDLTTDTNVSTTGKIKLFVIYAEDHPFHKEAVDSFIHYLNEHCFCEVLNTSPEYSSVPVYDMEKYCDFVLVLTSRAFCHEFCVWRRNETNSTPTSPICEQMFERILQGLKQSPESPSLASGYLVCAMNYTDIKYLPTEFDDGELFKIPDDMTDLVCHLQNLDLGMLDDCDVPCISQHMVTSDDGFYLTLAIEKATYFEMTHPNWFQENCTYLSHLTKNNQHIYKNRNSCDLFV